MDIAYWSLNPLFSHALFSRVLGLLINANIKGR